MAAAAHRTSLTLCTCLMLMVLAQLPAASAYQCQFTINRREADGSMAHRLENCNGEATKCFSGTLLKTGEAVACSDGLTLARAGDVIKGCVGTHVTAAFMAAKGFASIKICETDLCNA